jgi:hypothetical protein
MPILRCHPPFLDDVELGTGKPSKYRRPANRIAVGALAASIRSARFEQCLQRGSDSCPTWKLWGRAFLLFVRIAGEILPGLAGLLKLTNIRDTSGGYVSSEGFMPRKKSLNQHFRV